MGNIIIIITFISIVLTLITFIFSFISEKRTNKKKKILYEGFNTSFNFERIKKDAKGIEVYYDGSKLISLEISEFIFWNDGNDTIRQDDIPKNNKISISFPEECIIYDCYIKTDKNEDNNVELVQTKNYLELDFDFWEQKKGFIVKIVHSTFDRSLAKVNGRIIGGKEIKRLPEASYKKYVSSPKYYIIMASIITLLFLTNSLLAFYDIDIILFNLLGVKITLIAITTLLYGIAILVFLLINYLGMIYKRRNSKVPKRLLEQMKK